MIRYQFFPRSLGLSNEIKSIINCFSKVETVIDSAEFERTSNEVLSLVRPFLEEIGFNVEKGKGKDFKIEVPVLFGLNSSVDKCFNADALSGDGRIVIEVEAGRATENNQFLKDIFQASMMHNVEYLILVVRNRYRTHNDFEIIYTFLETLYVSNRVRLPLKGILVIGY